jgi:hypothetical protein
MSTALHTMVEAVKARMGWTAMDAKLEIHEVPAIGSPLTISTADVALVFGVNVYQIHTGADFSMSIATPPAIHTVNRNTLAFDLHFENAKYHWFLSSDMVYEFQSSATFSVTNATGSVYGSFKILHLKQI